MGSNVALLSSECCLSRRREMTHQAMHAFGAIPFERANDFHSLFADSGRRVSYLDTVPRYRPRFVGSEHRAGGRRDSGRAWGQRGGSTAATRPFLMRRGPGGWWVVSTMTRELLCLSSSLVCLVSAYTHDARAACRELKCVSRAPWRSRGPAHGMGALCVMPRAPGPQKSGRFVRYAHRVHENCKNAAGRESIKWSPPPNPQKGR